MAAYNALVQYKIYGFKYEFFYRTLSYKYMHVFAAQLSDGNREIKQAADNALAEFLREIKEAEVVEFGPMVNILVDQCHSKVFFNVVVNSVP